MAELKELTATLKIDSVKALKSLEKFNKFLSTIGKSVDSLQVKLTAMKTNLDVKVGASGKGVGSSGEGAKKAAKGFDELDKTLSETSKSTEKLGDETAKTTKKTEDNTKATKDNEARQKRLMDRLEGVRRGLLGVGEKTSKVNTKMRKLGSRFDGVGKKIVKLRDRVNSFGNPTLSGVVSISKAATLTLAGLSAATFGFVSKWAKATDSMAKSGDKFNIPFKELQGLSFAAELGGASAADMADAIKDMNLFISEATRDSLHPFNTALAQAGLSLADIKGKSVTEQVGIIADGLNRVEDAALTTELGMKTLGPASIQLGAFLKQGSKAIALQAGELERLGIALSPESAAEAAAFNDEVARTRALLSAIADLVASKLSPKMRKLLKDFRAYVLVNKDLIATRILEWLKRFVALLTTLGPKLLEMVSLLTDATEWLSKMVDELGGLEVVLGTAGAAFVTFKLAALASLNPVLAAVALLTAGFAAIAINQGRLRRREKGAAETAQDPTEQGGLTKTQLSKTAEGRKVLRTNILIAEIQDEITALGGGRTSQDIKHERQAGSIIEREKGKIFQRSSGESQVEKDIRARENIILTLRENGAKSLIKIQKAAAVKIIKDAETAESDPRRKRFTELQNKLLDQSVKLSKKELAELKTLGADLRINVKGLPDRKGGGGRSEATARDAVPLTLQQQIAKLLGTGAGLDVSSFRPSGVGTLIQHIDARVILEAPNISVTMSSSAQGKDLGREVGKGVYEELKDDIQRAFAAQEGIIRG